MRSCRILSWLAVLVVLSAGTSVADVCLKQANYTAGMEFMGQVQPAQHDTMEIWLGEDKACMKMAGQDMTVIVHVKAEKMFMIDHANKTYAELPLNLMEMLDQAVSGAGDTLMPDSMKEMVAGIAEGIVQGVKITVTPTDEKKKIGKWSVRKYNVLTEMAMMKANSEAWATEDIQIDYPLYHACTNAMMAQMPGFEDICREMQKIKGVTVEQRGTVNMMGTDVETISTLVDYAKKDAPPGTYNVPEGYKQVKPHEMGGREWGE
ncbi:MAG: hypothetical protein AB1744_05220 [Candidatus Zixiibacteriota bacterium]